MPRQLAAAVDGIPVRTVVDYVWGAPAEAMFDALARGGVGDPAQDLVYVEIGSMAGLEAQLPSALLRSRRITITGSGLGSMSPSAILARLPQLVERLADGRISVPYQAFPLSEIGAAWTADQGRRAVVVPDR